MHHSYQPGQILLDKYRVERVLGAGGMGIVVAARHLALDQLVAIKFMLGSGTPAELTRFVREARVASRLRSQHVARVLDVAAFDDGTPYIVLEHLDGRDLQGVLRERGVLPILEAVDALLQACEAIAEAHSLGIVHRDLKPANLFLTRGADGSPCIKVLDFGIAKWLSAGTEKLDVSRPMGSAPYMAPEQLAAPDRIDPRTDVWALGATLFHLLTGSLPFAHDGVDTVHAMMHAVLHRPPLRPHDLRPELPDELETVLLRCLEKNQAARFPSVAALAAALAPFGTEQASQYARRVARVLSVTEPLPELAVRPAVAAPVRMETVPVVVQAVQSANASSPEAPRSSPVAPRRDRTALLVTLAVGLLVAVGGLFAFARRGAGAPGAMPLETHAAAAEKPDPGAVSPALPAAIAPAPSQADSQQVAPAAQATRTQATPAVVTASPPRDARRSVATGSSASAPQAKPAAVPSTSTTATGGDLYGRRR